MMGGQREGPGESKLELGRGQKGKDKTIPLHALVARSLLVLETAV